MQTACHPISIAIIGCGAIVEQVRLPALGKVDEFAVSALVDPIPGQAERLASGLGQPAIFTDFHELPGGIDAALIATPNQFHAEQAVYLLERGIHVCVEKPLAPHAADCQRMIEAAKAQGRVLMTALDRRYRPQYLRVRQLVANQALGEIQRVIVREGGVHNWPSVSGFYTELGAAGGGVLMDAGIHALDQLLWWFSEPQDVSYADDSCGGPETECRLELSFSSGTSAQLEFSRLRDLGAMTEIVSDAGTLRFSPWSPKIEYSPTPGWPEVLPDGIAESGQAGAEGAVSLWRDFAMAIRTGSQPIAAAADGLTATRLVERCYGTRKPLARPWRDTPPAVTHRGGSLGLGQLRNRRVLVTGGSGFLGGRIVEKLRLQHDAEVNVLTRAPSRGLRSASIGARVFTGDIANASAVRAAARGCDLIIHCARDDTPDENERLRKTLEGTRNVIDAALENGVDRLVHVSSMVVYERPHGGTLDESCPRWSGQSIYQRLKCASEQMVLDAIARDGLRAAIVQPTIIYGPHGGWWTRGQLQRLGKRRLVLPAEMGTLSGGVCNLVYVDDAADAVLLAAMADAAMGESFLVSGSQPLTWVDFYRALDQVKGGPASVETLPLELLLEKRSSDAARTDRAIEYPDDHFLAELRFPATVDITKAQSALGYRPSFDLAAGMEITRQWAQWAGIASG